MGARERRRYRRWSVRRAYRSFREHGAAPIEALRLARAEIWARRHGVISYIGAGPRYSADEPVVHWCIAMPTAGVQYARAWYVETPPPDADQTMQARRVLRAGLVAEYRDLILGDRRA